ncbi:hypothetical protein DVJ78_06810 [Humibacter sp. BT305]|nr:hypothetical protein DVJ78_06810 [Humibacter sp. BT305]
MVRSSTRDASTSSRRIAWFRRGGWVIVLSGAGLAAVLVTQAVAHHPPHYDALSRPRAATDALPPTQADLLDGVVAVGSTRLLGTVDGTSYYLAVPESDATGLCFISADLVSPELSRASCHGPGIDAGVVFDDVALSDHRPADGWVEIAEDVWRDGSS